MKEFIKVMKVVSDPVRVKILKMLQRKVMCVCEIQAALGTTQPTTSKHLKMLESAGLIIHYKEGLWTNYTISNGDKNPYASTLIGCLRHWMEEDPEIISLVERLPFINRENICK